MAVITPNTDLYLLKVPLEIDDMNQLDFANATAQFNYFNSLPKYPVDDFTYQRKDGTIRFPAQYDELITYNYVMYRNTEYSNKWFYGFITSMEYVNDNMTLITIKSDVWQCWQFDLEFKPCLIDREHTNDDTIGNNVLPENLELGDLVTNGTVVNFGSSSDYCTVVEVSQIENQGENATLSYRWAQGETSTYPITPIINDISRGTTPLICDTSETSFFSSLRDTYDMAGLSDAIINVYRLPKALVGTLHYIQLDYTTHSGTTGGSGPFGIPATKNGVYNIDYATFNRPSTVDGYTPKNNKVLTYPFCYFNVSNNAGTSIPYHYEDFSEVVRFNIEGTFGPSGNTKAIPISYKNVDSSENGLDYSISGPKYPICSWKSDSYTNWLTQNSVNMMTEWKNAAITTGVGIVGGAIRGGVQAGATGAMIGAGAGVLDNAGGLISVAREQMLAKTSANMIPDQAHGNLNAGDIVWAKYKSPFTFIPMSVKAQFAKCADDYFSMFGYSTNRVKLPNIKGRRNWNYVKTIGCYIAGDIPQADMQEIRNMFDRGITIWHNPANFANYNANNDII